MPIQQYSRQRFAMARSSEEAGYTGSAFARAPSLQPLLSFNTVALQARICAKMQLKAPPPLENVHLILHGRISRAHVQQKGARER